MVKLAEAFNNNSEVRYIALNEIKPNPYQPRKVFDQALLEELANSILEYGVMQPITVRRNGEGFELVAGERRLRASKLAGKENIPAIIIEISDRDSAFLALMENLQRENLNFLEEAEGYLNLMQDYGLTQEEVATKLGKSQSNIANKVRVLKLPDDVKRALRDNGLTERHARALLKLPDSKVQMKVVNKIVQDGMNVKKTDTYVDNYIKKMTASGKKAQSEAKKFKMYIKNMKIYTNTITNAVKLINENGGEAAYTVNENDDEVQVMVTIIKKKF